MKLHAHDTVDVAPQRRAMPHRYEWAGGYVADPPQSVGDAASRSRARQQPGPLAARPGGASEGGLCRVQQRLAAAVARTTPTQLPDLLRTLSRQAGHLAHHPVNAFDNNPFIAREWLIVSQVLHAAAHSLENRFEALFLGP